MILKVFLWFACNSDVLKSRFYCRKTAIFKDLHVFWKCWLLSLFYIFLINFGVNVCDIFAHFSCKILFIVFNCFLVQKRCPKWTQNHPKIDPSASQGGVWLPGFIRSSLDMPFLRFLMPKRLPNWSKNDLKMTQSSPQWCPGPSKYRTFLQTVALASSFWAFRAAFVANGLVLSKTFPKNWGGAGGRGSALF